MQPTREQIELWHNDPRNWKWHLFYYNKQDSRLIVDKPNPNYGSTFNFAHPKSYLFFVGMACFFGFIILMITLSKK